MLKRNLFVFSLLPMIGLVSVFCLVTSSVWADDSSDSSQHPIAAEPAPPATGSNVTTAEKATSPTLERELIEKFLHSLTVDTLYEFSNEGLISHLKTESMTSSFLLEAAKTWASKQDQVIPKHYKEWTPKAPSSIHWNLNSHRGFSKGLFYLSQLMENEKLDHITREHLIDEASLLFEEYRHSLDLESCFQFSFFHFGVKSQTFCLSHIQWLKIQSALTDVEVSQFVEDLAKTADGLTKLTSLSLTTEELKELGGLAKATKEFGQQSPLQGDWGGWKGNLVTELIPVRESEANCLADALTLRGFLRYLTKTGRMKNFTVEEDFPYRKATFSWHTATVLRSKRTGARFVFDSWIDGFGQRPRIYRFEDWINSRDEVDLLEELHFN